MKHLTTYFALLFTVLVFAAGCSDDSPSGPPTTGTISGIVTNGFTGAVETGVSVTTLPASSTVSTNDSGRYTITNLQPGTYMVTLTKAGFETSTIQIAVTKGATANGDVMIYPPLPSNKGAIVGTVANFDTDAPISGVTIRTDPATRTVTTDAAGKYKLAPLDPGFYLVIASKGAFRPDTLSMTVTGGKTDTVNFPLRDSVPVKGLSAFYPFNGDAVDQSGNGLTGVVNGATLTTDRFGKAGGAFSFDGTGAHINFGDKPQFNFKGTDDFTITAWIKFTGTPTNNTVILSKAEKDPYIDGFEWFMTTDPRIQMHFGFPATNFTYAVASHYLNDGKWHFVGMTLSRSEGVLTAYVDSLYDPSSSQNFLKTGSLENEGEFIIGKGESPSAPFKGEIDDVRVYSRALDPVAMRLLYNENGWTGK